MALFEDHINESFGLSSHLDIDELRQLYYGRPNIYVNFTNDHTVNVEHDSLPEGILCYELNDVIGRKIQSSTFYAHVFRINKSGKRFVDDVRRYRKVDFDNDIGIITSMGWVDSNELDKMVRRARASSYHRFEFQRMWAVTRQIAFDLSSRNWRELWRDILLALGYAGFSDPSRTAMLGAREVRTLYIDYEGREDLDILSIQKHRSDPRRRIETNVERERKKMRGVRNRVAKRRTS